MAQPPLVSIVLPTYNGQRYLAEALTGVRDQTFSDWELILVDDASKDRTPEIAQSFATRDQRIRVIRNSVNRRLPASLNIGFAAARGRYFTWTSDDNIHRPGALARFVSELERDREVDVVYSHMTIIDDEGKHTRKHLVREPWALTFENPVMASFMYRRKVDEALRGYAEDKFLVEDWDFWLRAAKQFRFRQINEDLYLYRLHGASLTTQRGRDVALATLGLIEEHAHQLPWWDRRSAAFVAARRATLFAQLGDEASARSQLLRASRHADAARHLLQNDRYGLARALLGNRRAGYVLSAYLSVKRRILGVSPSPT